MIRSGPSSSTRAAGFPPWAPHARTRRRPSGRALHPRPRRHLRSGVAVAGAARSSQRLLDTAWWTPADLLALFAYVPPGQVLFASDSPYGTTIQAAILSLRCALQAGLTSGAGRRDRRRAGAAGACRGGRRRPRPGSGRHARALHGGPAARAGGRKSDVRRRPAHPRRGRLRSRSRWRGSPARSERTPRTRSCAPRCSSCSTATRSHAVVPESERLRFSDLWILATALTLARTPGGRAARARRASVARAPRDPGVAGGHPLNARTPAGERRTHARRPAWARLIRRGLRPCPARSAARCGEPIRRRTRGGSLLPRARGTPPPRSAR
jgi:hypothetical protein